MTICHPQVSLSPFVPCHSCLLPLNSSPIFHLLSVTVDVLTFSIILYEANHTLRTLATHLFYSRVVIHYMVMPLFICSLTGLLICVCTLSITYKPDRNIFKQVFVWIDDFIYIV